LQTLRKRNCSLSSLVLNSVLFWKLLVFQIPTQYIRDFASFNVCSFKQKLPLLHALQLVMFFALTLMHLEPELLFLTTFYNDYFLLIKYVLIVLDVNVSIHIFFSPHNVPMNFHYCLSCLVLSVCMCSFVSIFFAVIL
jgi:hypothetical protein